MNTHKHWQDHDRSTAGPREDLCLKRTGCAAAPAAARRGRPKGASHGIPAARARYPPLKQVELWYAPFGGVGLGRGVGARWGAR